MTTASRQQPRQVTPCCLHCDLETDRLTHDGLCATCDSKPCIHIMYVRAATWNPQHEAMLREFRRRALLQMPLFPLPSDLATEHPQLPKPKWWRASREGRWRRRHVG